MSKKAILAILDGWGIGTDSKVSAIDQANTPFIDSCYQKFPHTTLEASGIAVGLPFGQMGNSEVGHMNLGAGRVVYQNLVKLNIAVENATLGKENVITAAFDYALKNKKNIHFIGLLSDGGVHSHINHLKGLLTAAHENGLQDHVYVHAFTDGRDCDPHSGEGCVKEILDHMATTTGKLATVVGRYYAMDRDKRWERVKLAYDAMVNGVGEQTHDILSSITKAYENGITDEFLKPMICLKESNLPVAKIENDDVVFCFNFRTDRGREITEVLSQHDLPDYGMHHLNLYYVTMTNYDKNFKNVKVVFDEEVLHQTMGEILEKNGKTQIRVAETEKYPHVTFFFSGGREAEFVGESRILCPSPKVATYDLQPEMSAFDLTKALLPRLEQEEVDFVCLNFANGDMVGHTGVMEAAIKACEAVDQCAQKVITTALAHNYTTLVIADHGNCETMINPDGSPNTAHTTNPVPIILVDKELKFINNGVLSDIAPTILELMGVEKPEVMNRNSLLH